jgi:hypothetical protein
MNHKPQERKNHKKIGSCLHGALLSTVFHGSTRLCFRPMPKKPINQVPALQQNPRFWVSC